MIGTWESSWRTYIAFIIGLLLGLLSRLRLFWKLPLLWPGDAVLSCLLVHALNSSCASAGSRTVLNRTPISVLKEFAI